MLAPMLGTLNDWTLTSHVGLAALAGVLGAFLTFFVTRARSRVRDAFTQRLDESEARFRSIVDNAAEGIIIVGADGRIELFNAAAQRIFGYAAAEVIGRHVARLSSADELADSEATLHEYVTNRNLQVSGEPVELEGRRKDGSSFPIRLAMSEVLLDDHLTYTAIVTDLTDARTIEGQLAQAQKLKSIGQLAAGVAHEINTPGQYVTDNVRFLEEAWQDSGELLSLIAELEPSAQLTPEQLTRLHEIAAEADLEYLIEEIPKAIRQSLEGLEQITRIVRAMKELSHPGGEELSLIDVNHALENAVTVARNEWRYVAEVTTEFEQVLTSVPVYEGELNQVFLNLIVNAAHAIEKSRDEGAERPGRITLATSESEEWVEIRIQDNGTGIAPEHRERVFDPFFTTKGVGRGTGQGLSLAHAVIVEKHGGELLLETEVGVGTTFVIRLPKERAGEEHQAAA